MTLEQIPRELWPEWLEKLVRVAEAALQVKPDIDVLTLYSNDVRRIESYMRRKLKPVLKKQVEAQVEAGVKTGEFVKTAKNTLIRERLNDAVDNLKLATLCGRTVRTIYPR